MHGLTKWTCESWHANETLPAHNMIYQLTNISKPARPTIIFLSNIKCFVGPCPYNTFKEGISSDLDNVSIYLCIKYQMRHKLAGLNLT